MCTQKQVQKICINVQCTLCMSTYDNFDETKTKISRNMCANIQAQKSTQLRMSTGCQPMLKRQKKLYVCQKYI